MQLRKPEHQDIFYPSDPQLAKELCNPTINRAEDLPISCLAAQLPAAILAPHAAWQWILPQLRQALRTVAHLRPRQIILLAPLHQQVILQDIPKFVFIPSQSGAATPAGDIFFADQARESILAKFPQIIGIQDCYYTEEPAVELFYPLLASFFPQVPVLPLLAAGNCSSVHCKQLAGILQNLLLEEPRTLYIVTSNMSEETSCDKACQQAWALQEALCHGQPLLEAKTQGKISCCAVQWLEALERLDWPAKGWLMLSASKDGENFLSEVPMKDIVTDDKRHVVWHGVALHR